jgi:hypothetical protein
VNDTSLRLPAEDRSREIVFSNGSYVDGPLASVFCGGNGWRPSVICPAYWRGLGPLALMKSDDPRLPIKGASSGLVTHCGVSDGLRSSRRVAHHVVVALAKLISLRSPFGLVIVTTRGLRMAWHAESQSVAKPRGRATRPARPSVSVCKTSRVTR